MADTKEQLKQERDQRMDTAISLGTPDRVPFAPKMSAFYMLGYGISIYDAMKDARLIGPGYRAFLREYEPDAVNMAGLYAMDPLEALGCTFLRWPGPTHDLPLDSSFQHLDKEFLHDDEYQEFIDDPTHMILTKILPRKYERLAGLSKLYLRESYDATQIGDLAVFADPDVQKALQALADAGKATNARNQQMAYLRNIIAEEGFSTYCQCGAFVIPFDAFADSIRGILRTVQDIYEYPEELEAVVNKLTKLNAKRQILKFKERGAKRVFIPLHCGVDEFMSNANYEKFYWSNLKQCIMMIIENGMTPVCFCEGNYNSRLEIISDVPKGKVVYMFEKVDLKRAKETVGKVACICGTVPNALLAFGTEEQVINETRRQLDILAPGGGFIMDCSIMLDNASHKNMHAWRETTLKYGCY